MNRYIVAGLSTVALAAAGAASFAEQARPGPAAVQAPQPQGPDKNAYYMPGPDSQ